MADELDDQLLYHFEEEPDVIPASQPLGSSVEDGPEIINRKRKAPSAPETLEPTVNDSKKRKAEKQKARSRARLKEKKRIKNEQDRAQKLEIAKQEPPVIADFIVSILRREDENLSALELQDRAVPESAIVNTSDEIVDRYPENYPKFFSTFGLDDAFEQNELVVVLCLSVERIHTVARMLVKCDKHGILSLSKEQSARMSEEALKKSHSHIAVSTPGRIQKLINMGALSRDRIKRVVVDTSIVDAKQRSLWEFAETIPLVSDLAKNHGTRVYLF